MPQIEGLRSPYDQVEGVCGFGRTVDKIRLHLRGKLPKEYVPFLGGHPEVKGLDFIVCRILGIDYQMLVEEVKAGKNDVDLLHWAYQLNKTPIPIEIECRNAFMYKLGWRDEAISALEQFKVEYGVSDPDVKTIFDILDKDEERPLRFQPDPAPFNGECQPTIRIEGLRSPHAELSGLVHFGRMLDKIRLFHEGKLPDEWCAGRGDAVPGKFDSFCCQFLEINYGAIEQRTLEGGTDEEIMGWILNEGVKRTKGEIRIWNAFMRKRGWRDAITDRLHQRLEESGFPLGAALTMFDYIVLDEGLDSARLPG
jgi:hypothetical protein